VTVAEEYVRSPEVALRVQALGGATAAMAVLVNSDAFATAQWGTFQPNLVVTLGPTDGIYEVWVGFKGLSPGADRGPFGPRHGPAPAAAKVSGDANVTVSRSRFTLGNSG